MSLDSDHDIGFMKEKVGDYLENDAYNDSKKGSIVSALAKQSRDVNMNKLRRKKKTAKEK